MPPPQKPGRSKQDYQTPPEFLTAVRRLLGITQFAYDLAASRQNAVCPRFYTEADNALTQSWVHGGWNWLNPPYADIRPWVVKATLEALEGARTAMLLPAGVGSNWWAEWVHRACHVILLNGRITFVGCSVGYPKDCVLLLYGPTAVLDYDVWTWTFPIIPRKLREIIEVDNGAAKK